MNTIATFTPYTATRKAMIQHVRARLINPENRPTKHPVYGNKNQVLFLQDYAVYAALRGADIRKTSHMPEGENAKEAIKQVLNRLSYLNESHAEKINQGAITSLSDYLPEGATYEDVVELREILTQALNA